MIEENISAFVSASGVIIGAAIVLLTKLNTKRTTPQIIAGLSLMMVSVVAGIVSILR